MRKSQNQNIRHSSQEELTKLGAVDAIDYVINAIRTEGTIKMGLPEVCNNSQVEVKEQGADVNAIDSSSDFTELVKKLMADTDSDGNTVLHCAAKTSQWYTVQWLVKQGADINVEDNVGRTVLNYAVLNIVMYGLTR